MGHGRPAGPPRLVAPLAGLEQRNLWIGTERNDGLFAGEPVGEAPDLPAIRIDLEVKPVAVGKLHWFVRGGRLPALEVGELHGVGKPRTRFVGKSGGPQIFANTLPTHPPKSMRRPELGRPPVGARSTGENLKAALSLRVRTSRPETV